jgi:pantoate--beta-alanine ligase
MAEYSRALRRDGARVGFVPTMGALHDGHLSLLKIASEHCDHTIMSIFVNPAQFGPAEDFDRYPRRIERDCELAEAAGCDCVFIPSADDMYPAGYSTYVDVGGGLAGALCGASRPGHFRGVATVVLKLFNVAAPDTAVFGESLKEMKELYDKALLPLITANYRKMKLDHSIWEDVKRMHESLRKLENAIPEDGVFKAKITGRQG